METYDSFRKGFVVAFGRPGQRVLGIVTGRTAKGLLKLKALEPVGRRPAGTMWKAHPSLCEDRAGAILTDEQKALAAEGDVREKALGEWRKGDRVEFSHSGRGTIRGVVTSVNRKSVSLDCGSDGKWRCSPLVIRRAEGWTPEPVRAPSGNPIDARGSVVSIRYKNRTHKFVAGGNQAVDVDGEGSYTVNALIRFRDDGQEFWALLELSAMDSGEHCGTGVWLADGSFVWDNDPDFWTRLGRPRSSYDYRVDVCPLPFRDYHTRDDGWNLDAKVPPPSN